MSGPWAELCRIADRPAPPPENPEALLCRLLTGARDRIAEAGRQDDFEEVVGRLDPDGERFQPDVFWEAACIVGARMREERAGGGLLRRTLADLEAELLDMEPDLDDEEAWWFGTILPALEECEKGAFAAAMIESFERDAKEMRGWSPELGRLIDRVLAHLERLREDRGGNR